MSLSISQVFQTGWQAFLANWLIFIGATLLWGVLAADILPLPIIGPLISAGLYLGVIKLSLQAVDGEKLNFQTVFSQFGLLLKFIVLAVIIRGLMPILASIPLIVSILLAQLLNSWHLTVLIVAIGAIISMAGYLYIILKYFFLLYVLVDRRDGIIATIITTGQLSIGHFNSLLVLFLLEVLLILVGVLFLGVGLLVTIPLVNLIFAAAYRQLTQPTIVVKADEISELTESGKSNDQLIAGQNI